MQLPWDEHFIAIVIPAWQAYLRAEHILSEVFSSKDGQKIQMASHDALREGGAASFYAHHFADVVMRDRPAWLPNDVKKLAELRTWVGGYCTALRTEKHCNDISLLGDVADALKHSILTHRVDEREVSSDEAVLVVKKRYGGGRYGEGKFGGIEVTILAKSGQRPLSSVLQNTIDAWRRAAHLPMPEIGNP